MSQFNPSDLKYEFKDFIGIYENAYTKEECEYIIDFFKIYDKKGFAYDRIDKNNYNILLSKNDTSLTVCNGTKTEFGEEIIKPFNERFWSFFYPIYVHKYPTIQNIKGQKLVDFKVQRTLLTEGYHIWHYEHNYSNKISKNRIFAWILYLNDIRDGGETEFLYQSLRIKPKTGTFIIFPAYFTHTHRGNPPLSGEKYIATGWIEYDDLKEKQKINYA